MCDALEERVSKLLIRPRLQTKRDAPTLTTSTLNAQTHTQKNVYTGLSFPTITKFENVSLPQSANWQHMLAATHAETMT